MTDLTRYADAIFGFCLRRVHSIEDARDLSQDILCEALASLPGADVRCFEAWLWTVARNRYCRYLRDRKRVPLSLEGSRLADTLIADAPALPGPEQQAVFEALHTLAQAHRDILVDHYVRGLSCEQIAQSRGLKSETVRTRLFYGREKLRERWQHQMNENRIYSPQDWFVSGNGDVDVSLLDRQITRSVLSACYGGFTSVEQIALATGLPCLYIEDELQRLWHSELVEEKGSRYRASLIIHRDGFAQAAEKLLLDHTQEIADKLLNVLDAFLPRIRATGFSGCELPFSRLGWSLIPRLMREACEQTRAQIPEAARCAFPTRRDGSRGWLCAYESAAGVHRYFSGCNAYYLDGSHFRYYWSTSLFSEALSSLLRRLESVDWFSPPPGGLHS